MKLRFSFISVLLLCLGLCSSCEDERFDTGSTMPDGQFIVDYTAEAGTATRALHEDVPASKRINSLTYLLYSEDGTLLKRREVPKLDGDEDTWPLRRETMTWEQREALKDTLQTNTTYHAVFIANIDSAKLWYNVAPLKSAGDYNDAYIELPDQPFEDGNMFYYFAQDINSADKGADRDTPYNCSVQLHRIVTRADFFFEQLPAWDGLLAEENTPSTTSLRADATDEEGEQPIEEEITPPTEEGGTAEEPTDEGDEPSDEDDATTEEGEGDDGNEQGSDSTPWLPIMPIYPEPCTLPEEIQTYLKPYMLTVVTDTYSEMIATPITTSTQAFLEEIQTYFQDKADALDENSPEKGTFQNYANRIEGISDAIANGGESNQTFLSAILQETEKEGEEATSKFYIHLQNWILNRCGENPELKALWKRFEERKDPFYAEVHYNEGGGLNQFDLNRTKTTTNLIKNTPRVAADTIATFEGKTYRGFNVVGFADPDGNVMQSVMWYENKTTVPEEEPYEIKLYKEDGTESIQTGQDINEKVTIQYRPVAGLALKENGASQKKKTKIVCNLENALPFGGADETLVEAIKEALKSGAITGAQSLLEETILELEWPDLSKPEVLKITPDWKIDKGN